MVTRAGIVTVLGLWFGFRDIAAGGDVCATCCGRQHPVGLASCPAFMWLGIVLNRWVVQKNAIPCGR